MNAVHVKIRSWLVWWQ